MEHPEFTTDRLRLLHVEQQGRAWVAEFRVASTKDPFKLRANAILRLIAGFRFRRETHSFASDILTRHHVTRHHSGPAATSACLLKFAYVAALEWQVAALDAQILEAEEAAAVDQVELRTAYRRHAVRRRRRRRGGPRRTRARRYSNSPLCVCAR